MSLIEKNTVDSKAVNPKVSTGIFTYDVALGGGFRRGTFNLIVGKESTGKTLIAQKSMDAISKYDWETGLFGGFTKCLWIDLELAWDGLWADKVGFDDRHKIVVASNGTEAVAMAAEAIESRDYGMIVIDSFERCYPVMNDARDIGDSLPGRRAMLIADAYRYWVRQLTTMVKDRENPVPRHQYPIILGINQFRMTIGGPMHSDPRIIPGGEAQKFYNATITYTNSVKYTVDDFGASVGAFSGSVKKNKTSVPRRNFNFSLGISGEGDLDKGEIDNFKQIKNILRPLIVKEKSKWLFLDQEYKTQKEIEMRIKEEPAFYDTCWNLAMSAALTGSGNA